MRGHREALWVVLGVALNSRHSWMHWLGEEHSVSQACGEVRRACT